MTRKISMVIALGLAFATVGSAAEVLAEGPISSAMGCAARPAMSLADLDVAWLGDEIGFVNATDSCTCQQGAHCSSNAHCDCNQGFGFCDKEPFEIIGSCSCSLSCSCQQGAQCSSDADCDCDQGLGFCDKEPFEFIGWCSCN